MEEVMNQALSKFDLCDGLKLIRSEYLEMPGLHLTRRQMQRLWGLDAERCDSLVDTLESSHFLKRLTGGTYVRAIGDPR
jgi:hypothetical protein